MYLLSCFASWCDVVRGGMTTVAVITLVWHVYVACRSFLSTLCLSVRLNLVSCRFHAWKHMKTLVVVVVILASCAKTHVQTLRTWCFMAIANKHKTPREKRCCMWIWIWFDYVEDTQSLIRTSRRTDVFGIMAAGRHAWNGNVWNKIICTNHLKQKKMEFVLNCCADFESWRVVCKLDGQAGRLISWQTDIQPASQPSQLTTHPGSCWESECAGASTCPTFLANTCFALLFHLA